MSDNSDSDGYDSDDICIELDLESDDEEMDENALSKPKSSSPKRASNSVPSRDTRDINRDNNTFQQASSSSSLPPSQGPSLPPEGPTSLLSQGVGPSLPEGLPEGPAILIPDALQSIRNTIVDFKFIILKIYNIIIN